MGGRDAMSSPPVGSPAFVGRDRALAGVTGALSRGPATVLVEGEAGIGKTRLVRELLTRPEAAPPVLVAICPPLRESLTLGPIVDAVRLCRDRLAGLPLSALAGALRPFYPEWADELPPSPEPLADAKAARHRLFRALAELIGCLGVSVLVVEDAHWADDVTLEFVLYLASRSSLNLIVTYRPEDVPAGSSLRRLSARAETVRVALQPLPVAGTAALVSSMLDGEPVSQAFAAFLHEATGGIPLAVEESVRLLRDRADLVRDEGEWIRRSLAELQVPPTVRDAVLERVQRLSPPAQRILAAASVLADPADEAVLLAVTSQPARAARHGLAEAVGSGLLQEDPLGRMVFRHALAAKAVYEATPGPARRRLHLRAGQALEAGAPPPVAQLAHHFRRAGDVERWARYAEQAAQLAVASGDHDTAAAGLHDLLDTAGPSLAVPVRARLAVMLGNAARFRRHELDDRHRRIGDTLRGVLDAGGLDPREQAAIRYPLGRLLAKQGDNEAAAAEIERAVPYLGHTPGEQARAMIFLAWPLGGSSWPAVRHLHWLERAGQVDIAGAATVDRIALTADRAAVLLCLGRSDGWAVAAELPPTAASMEGRRHIAGANANLGAAAMMWGCYPEARRRVMVARSLADAEGFEWMRSTADAMLIELDWLTGSWDGLAGRAAASVEVDNSLSNSWLVAGLLAAARGDRADAVQQVGRGLSHAARQGQAHIVAQLAGALAGLRLAEGCLDEALRLTDEPIQLAMRKRVWVWVADPAPVRVEALVEAGRVEEANQLVRMFANGLRGRDAPAPRAALALCRAILAEAAGEPGRAAVAYGRAAQHWERLRRPYDAFRARERQGRCLLAAGKLPPAREVLSTVQRGFATLGARADADRVARELRQQGVSVPRPWRGGRTGYGDRISPRELEVVRLVAAGKTNAQIARALSRSTPTVSTQLHSAMRKLDVSSRTELAVKAIATGLVRERDREAG